MVQTRTISTVIVDNHELMRKGIVSALRPYEDILISGEANSGTQAIKVCSQVCPDVVIVDVKMAEMDGATVIRLIQYHHPNIQVIVLSDYISADLVHAAFEAGATSYIMKDVSSEELVDAIRATHMGRSTIAHEVAQVLIRKPERVIENQLTSREQQVLRLLMKGYKNDEIAKELVITLATVKKHVRKVLLKLGVETRTQAVAFAYENELMAMQ